MNTKSRHRATRSIAAALVAAACICNTAPAALSITAIRSLQKAAPEKVTIKITAAEKKEKKRGGSFSFEMTVKAQVVAVASSDAGLKVGDKLEISYSFPNFEKSSARGDWPGEVVKGKNYKAYLRVTDKKAKTANPAAASGSFERVKDKKAKTANPAAASGNLERVTDRKAKTATPAAASGRTE